MSGIFPHTFDGGLPANPGAPNDPAQAHLHRWKLPIDTPALYYGNGCDVRLRPHVLNSLISEIASIADRAGVGYRASSLQNAETSIRYLIQRGLPHGAMLDETEESAWHFTFRLAPPPPCYTDFMTVTFVPRFIDSEFNRGRAQINMNGLGFTPLYRHDGSDLRSGDLLHLKPFLAVHFNGAWYIIGRIPPEFRPGGIDLWVRTDGNDETGDGTANSPDKAFRTIEGAFASVGERFLSTPLFTANIKLGIPGTYEAAIIGPFGSNLTISGGGSDAGGWGGGTRWDYRIGTKFMAGESIWISLQFNACNNVQLFGITATIANSDNNASALLVGSRTSVTASSCAFEATASNPNGRFLDIRDSSFGFDESQPGNDGWFQGNGHTLAGAIVLNRGGMGVAQAPGFTLYSRNFDCRGSYLQMSTLSFCTFGGMANNAHTGITGMQYSISTNSILYHNLGFPSGPIPGTVAGTDSLGAIVVPGFP